LRRSRRTFLAIFEVQYSTLVAGIRLRLHPCQCQRQPFTKTAIRAEGMTKSGLPGRRSAWLRNRILERRKKLRTNSSGFVPCEETLDMIQLRVAASNVSVMFKVAVG
jgi:hypothetical protein